VKLHEFRIGDNGSRARGDRKPEATGLNRIGRHGIEMPDAAGRQHYRARRNRHGICGGVADFTQLKPCDRAILGQQRFGGVTLDHPDRGRRPYGFDQRRYDCLAGHIAAHMHDAPGGMRGFSPDCKPAFEVAIERDAVVKQVADARAGLARQSQCYRLIDEARADGDRVGGMRFRAVAFGDRGRDATLRPRRRGALAQRCCRDHGDRARRQFQRTEQSGEAAADDDDIVGFAGEVV